MSWRTCFVLTLTLGASATRSSAQSFNVDIGVAGTPSSAFGAAPAQAGQWNVFQFGALPSTSFNVLGLQAQPTGVVMTQTNGRVETCDQGPHGGDVGALLDDHQTTGTGGFNEPAVWELVGLTPGDYELYLYVATRCLAMPVRFEFLAGSSGSADAQPADYLGAWVEGITHLRVPFTQLPGTPIRFQLRHLSPSFDNSILSGIQVRRLGGQSRPICSGDSAALDHTTPCPCGNFGNPGHGCAHSSNAGGAHLQVSGATNPDSIVLAASNMPTTAFAIYMQHDATGDAVFHDGVLCASGNLLRIRGRSSIGGASSFPNLSDTTNVSTRGQVTPGSGERRYYATWYRNASTTFCPPATANVTNGWILDW